MHEFLFFVCVLYFFEYKLTTGCFICKSRYSLEFLYTEASHDSVRLVAEIWSCDRDMDHSWLESKPRYGHMIWDLVYHWLEAEKTLFGSWSVCFYCFKIFIWSFYDDCMNYFVVKNDLFIFKPFCVVHRGCILVHMTVPISPPVVLSLMTFHLAKQLVQFFVRQRTDMIRIFIFVNCLNG